MTNDTQVKHTPGPWSISYSTGVVMNQGGSHICRMFSRNKYAKPWPSEEGDANARLISSAPELLEYAKELVNAVKDNADETVLQHISEELEHIECAIAKAKERGE